jgi:hypothetical protein
VTEWIQRKGNNSLIFQEENMDWPVLGRIFLLVAMLFGGYMWLYLGSVSPIESWLSSLGLNMAEAELVEVVIFFSFFTAGLKLAFGSRR